MTYLLVFSCDTVLYLAQSTHILPLKLLLGDTVQPFTEHSRNANISFLLATG